MGIKGPMPPNTLRVSNIREGVSQEDLHRMFSNFGPLESIDFGNRTYALVKFINFYHGECVDEAWFLIGVLVGFMFCSLHFCNQLWTFICAILIMPLN